MIPKALSVAAAFSGDRAAEVAWFKFWAVWQLPEVTAITGFVLAYANPGRWLTRRTLGNLTGYLARHCTHGRRLTQDRGKPSGQPVQRRLRFRGQGPLHGAAGADVDGAWTRWTAWLPAVRSNCSTPAGRVIAPGRICSWVGPT
jgi:hypothetical protein